MSRIRALFSLALVLAAGSAQAFVQPLWSSRASSSGTVASAYYVATNGSDSNAGTSAAPFATFGKCQTAMRASQTLKTCYVRGGTYSSFTTTTCPTQGWSAVLDLDSADSGETWQYYPPDGVDSAILNGTSSIKAGFCINSQNGNVSNITIDGLNFENFQYAGIFQQGGANPISGSIIKNNQICCTQYNVVSLGVGIYIEENSPNTTIANNYIYNTGNMGINGTAHSTPGGLNNLTITNNITVNSPGCGDCGAIYMDDYGAANGTSGWSTNIQIKNNYCDNSLGYCIYLDDGTSNVTATGNVMIPGVASGGNPGHEACGFIHGGNNDVYEYNICDNYNGGVGAAWLWGAPVSWPAGCGPSNPPTCNVVAMTGDVYENNINICNSSSKCTFYGYAADQWFGGQNPPHDFTIMNNLYWNYSTGGVQWIQQGSTPIGSDSSPITGQNPSITCWKANISNPPSGWSALSQSWGPLGTINPASLPGSPATATPSWGPSC